MTNQERVELFSRESGIPVDQLMPYDYARLLYQEPQHKLVAMRQDEGPYRTCDRQPEGYGMETRFTVP